MPLSMDPTSYEPPQGERPVVTPPVELKRRPHDPYAAFRFGGFSLFTAGNLLSITGRLMLAVAVEWEIYARTENMVAFADPDDRSAANTYKNFEKATKYRDFRRMLDKEKDVDAVIIAIPDHM